jgi:basic endochitinase B
VDLLSNPELVATGPVMSFKTALWFWMTPRDNKPSCHAVITGQWTPTAADVAAGRVPGYGVITNIINWWARVPAQAGPPGGGPDRLLQALLRRIRHRLG